MIFVIIAVALKRARINAKLFSKHGQFDFSIFCTRNSSKNIINNKTQIQQRPIYSDVLKTLFKRWFLHLSCAYTQCLCYIYMYVYEQMHLRRITVHASGLRQTRMTKRKRFITNTHTAFATAAAVSFDGFLFVRNGIFSV